jgi:hypothetical protein
MDLTYLNDVFEYRDGNLYWKKSNNRKIKVGNKVGFLNNHGYIQTKIFNKTMSVHRIIYFMNHKTLPDLIDHINGIKTDNRIENLRPATKSQNNQNCAIRKDNSSGVKNICWDKNCNKWRVFLQTNKKRKSFGVYDDLELAELVAVEARNKYHKQFANHGKIF